MRPAEVRRLEHLTRRFQTPALAAVFKTARNIRDLRSAIEAIESRAVEIKALDYAGETARSYTVTLVGMAASPRARALLEVAIDQAVIEQAVQQKQFRARSQRPAYVPEVIIGGGLHAAIYASTKVAAGGQVPLVIENRRRIGGIFGIAERPMFYLNSRNRPEARTNPRKPGTPGPLNSQISGVIQPSDISYREYQTQDEFGLAVRLNLVLYANIIVDRTVTNIARNRKGPRYTLDFGKRQVITDQVIIATGVGTPSLGGIRTGEDPRILNFEEWLQTMGSTANSFPLKDYKKVAVIGANDSGKVVVEYLIGQGPQPGLSTAALDTVEQIAWIGQECPTKEEFERCNRSRYKGIGRAMPRSDDPDYYYRVDPINGRAIEISPLAKGVRVKCEVDGRQVSSTFDLVIICTGFEDKSRELFDFPFLERPYEVNGRVVATAVLDDRKKPGIFKVGPCAQLPVTAEERLETPVLEQIPDNSVALFRYSVLTAALAAEIGRVESRNRSIKADTVTQARYGGLVPTRPEGLSAIDLLTYSNERQNGGYY